MVQGIQNRSAAQRRSDAGLPEFASSLVPRSRYNSPVYMVLKRMVDLSVAVAMLLILAPLFLIVSVLILLTDGRPIFYSHSRVGKGGKVFRMLKFRTMVRNADEVLKRDPELYAEYLRNWKLDHDPRVTKIGAWLRSTSVDEFPQLWNVIRGEMSLVGPRPIQERELAMYDAHAAEVYRAMVPGCAGLWQCSGRSDTTYEERLRLDEQYLRTASVRADVKIMIMTGLAILRREGAH